MEYLHEVMFNFDKHGEAFSKPFFELFHHVCSTENGKIFLKRTHDAFLPRVTLNINASGKGVSVDFIGDQLHRHIKVENTTHLEKSSHEMYRSIDVHEFIHRCDANNIIISTLDHIGFNLPWFCGGIHPEIDTLRKELSQKCLYHTFPGGEPWDFILPGFQDEISSSTRLDYHRIRKPKIELVSFEKCSTPIIQFDVCCSCQKTLFQDIFPEGLYDPLLGNIWIYLNNPFRLDICLILNEEYEGDWGHYFKENRITL